MELTEQKVEEIRAQGAGIAAIISILIGIFIFGAVSQQSWGKSSILLRDGRLVECNGETVTTPASIACYSGKRIGLIGAQKVSFAALKSDVAAINIRN